MIRLSILLLTLYFMKDLQCGAGKALNQESVRVTQHSPTPRVRRDLRHEAGIPGFLTGSDFPDFMEFTVHLSNGDVRLSLEKHMSPDQVDFQDENGKIALDRKNEQLQYAVYQDTDVGSTMLVECWHDRDNCVLTGSFYSNGLKWNLEPTDIATGEYKAMEDNAKFDPKTIKGVNVNDVVGEEKIKDIYEQMLNGMTSPNTKANAHIRRKRSSSTCNIVELMIIADHTIWEYFLSRQAHVIQDAEVFAEAELLQHYLTLFGQVDLRYKCLIDYGICLRVYPSLILIEKTPPSFANVPGAEPNTKDAYNALLTCGPKREAIAPELDFLICLTGNNLEGLGTSLFRAYSWIDVICNDIYAHYQNMVSEDFHDDTDLLIAHVMLFGMNVLSDSDIGCDPNLNFAGSDYNDPPSSVGTEQNPWKFSECTRSNLTDYLSSSNSHCLRDSGGLTPADVDAVYSSTIQPGDIYDLQWQCEYTFGLGYTPCIGPNETSITDIDDMCWRGVYCSDGGTCEHRTRIYNGSPCGCKRSCYKNVCVRDFNTTLGGSCGGCCECAVQDSECDCMTKTCQCRPGFYNESGVCIANCPIPPDSPNGYFRLNSTNTPGGTIATLECCLGFSTWGTVEITCLGGIWTDPTSNCSLINCGSFPNPDDGSFSGTGMTVGSVATLSCDEGYTLTSSAGTCIVCQPDGNWSTVDAECIRDCGSTPMVENGNFQLDGDATTFNNTATLVCCEGYVSSGSAGITCNDNGWSNTTDTCELINCGAPPSTVNGDFVAQNTTTVGSIATISCDQGYGLPASSISDACIVCKPNGSWSDSSANCTNDCGSSLPPDPNGSFVFNEGNTLEGATATLECCDGYSANVTITCDPSGWSTPSSTCLPNSCGNTPSVSNGEFMLHVAPSIWVAVFGDIATLECNENYTASSSDTCILCTEDGSWTSAAATCIRDCGSTPLVENGNFQLDGDATTFNATATLVCCEGYVSSGNAGITCDEHGWSNITDTCELIDCGAPPSTVNGVFVAQTTTTVGSIATISCNQGNGLPASSISEACIVCQPDGKWSDSSANCTNDCGSSLPNDPNGSFVLNDGNTLEGATATLECCDGYSASVTITCYPSGWSSPSSTCSPNNCDETPYVSNGEFVTMGSPVFGDIGTLECDENYTASSSETCIRCTEDGSWTCASATCIRDCGSPPLVENGNFQLDNEDTTANSTASLVCCEGYVSSGSAGITCDDNGWSTTTDTCELIDCGAPPSAVNGFFLAQTTTTVGSIATINCSNSFGLPASSISDACIVCQPDGNWSNSSVVCINNCGIPPFWEPYGSFVLVDGNTLQGSTATLVCCPGYSADVSISCGPSGWSSPSSVCSPDSCGNTPPISNGGFVTVGSPVFGDIATLECNEHYTPSSSDTCIRCTDDGSWSNANATCIRDCGQPPSSTTGSFVLDDLLSTILDSEATLLCCDGYTGSATITCTNSGWSSPGSSCQPVDCGDPGSVANGNYSTPHGTSLGSIAVLDCDDNYSPSTQYTGDLMDTCIVCLPNGSWSGASTTCIRDCGPVLPPTVNGHYDLDDCDTLLGATAQLICCDGYSGSDNITCTEDGWSDPAHACTIIDCGAPTAVVQNGQYIPVGTTVGSIATLSCNGPEYTPSDDSCIVCQPDGTWSVSNGTCLSCPSLEWIKFESNCYYFGTHSMVYSHARIFCDTFDDGAINSNLVQVDSMHENDFLKNFMLDRDYQPSKGYWHDLFQNGPNDGGEVWRTTGDAPTFLDWNTGEPNDSSGTQSCSSFWKGFHYRWTDVECANTVNAGEQDNRKLAPVCEIPQT